ncbi:MAG: FkbM family methyltransferase [Paludibacter sp.]
MRQEVKNVLGVYLSYHLINFRAKWFPSKAQKEILQLEEEENQKRQIFYSGFLFKNDLCFDVGANHGNRITPILNLGVNVVAVEPQKSCYRYLEVKFGKKIKIVKKGLGEKECVKDFHISDASTISSFSDEWIESVKEGRFKNHTWNKTVKVEMTTLDKLIEQFGTPAFIKIDVEGYELDVLSGLSKQVKMISFEYTVPEHTEKVLKCIDSIEKNGANLECNYSVGESMDFELKSWISVKEMKEHIVKQEFTDTDFGDIYVRIKK